MTDPNGAPPGQFYDAASDSYILSPAGTYSPGGLQAPITDPGGYYSATGASAPTIDPAGTYSSPYALNRIVLESNQNTPATSVLSFHNATQVANYYGVGTPEAAEAATFFSQNYDKTSATMMFTRIGLGQRPHLLGANISTVDPTTLVNGSISLTFNGVVYSGTVFFGGVTNLQTVANHVLGALNSNLPVEATTTGDTISSQTVSFTGYFNGAQLHVTAGSGIQVGGLVHGVGVRPAAAFNNQIIYQRSGVPGGPGTYSGFAGFGRHSTPEPMTETFGVLTVGTETSGAVNIGQEIIGTGIPPDTAIIANLSGTTGPGSQWLVNNAIDIPGDFTMVAPPLTVENQFMVGATQNNDFLEIQPHGAFGFDNTISTLSYASGPVADELGLSQATGAILSSPGGHNNSTMAQFMNNIMHNETDQFGNPVQFGSVQTNEPRFGTALSLWVQNSGLGHQFLLSTTPAGMSTPVTDPPGTHSGPGASAPLPGAALLAAANQHFFW